MIPWPSSNAYFWKNKFAFFHLSQSFVPLYNLCIKCVEKSRYNRILFMFWHSCYFMLKIVKIGMLKKVEIHLQEKTGCVGYPSVSFKNRLECIRQKTKQLYERWLFCRLTFPLSTIDDTKTSYTSKKACAEFLCIFKKVFWILMTFSITQDEVSPELYWLLLAIEWSFSSVPKDSRQ